MAEREQNLGQNSGESITESQNTPQDIRLITAFCKTGQNAVIHLKEMHGEDDQRLAPFMDAIVDQGAIVLPTTDRYYKDMEMAGRNALQRLFGIELDTLSPNIQLILYPKMIYKPTKEELKEAKKEGYEMRTEGPQAMIYVLDGFENKAQDVENMAANLYFIGHMVRALLENKYPIETGERSPEFKAEVKQALALVREYNEKLLDTRRKKLSPIIARISKLDETELEEEAHKFTLYHVQPMKMPGLYESERIDAPSEKPKEAVRNKILYLHLDERDLPLRIKEEKTENVPSLPWKEYGKNRWNRSHQLFGRYEAPTIDGALRVDFRLDSTHMPALYGFFDTIEITKTRDSEIKEHIIFGQEMGGKAELAFLQFFGANLTPEQLQDSVVPIIIAGKLDFSNSETQELLRKLAEDKGTKPDVGRVVADVLRLGKEGRLKRLSKKRQKE